MTTSAKSAFHTLVQYGDGASPELFANIAELTNVDPPEAVAKTVEVTSHDSTKGEHIATYVDEGELSLEGNYIADTGQEAVRAKIGSATLTNYQVCFPDFGTRTATFTTNYAVNSQLTSNSHGITTGQPFQVSTSGTLPAGLSASTTYYARYVTANTITVHTTNAGAVAGTGAVSLTSDGSGTHTIRLGTREAFAGILTSFKLGPANKDSAITCSMKFKVTGANTYTT